MRGRYRRRHPRVFSPFYLSMIRVGESTGLLETVFFRLFEHLEFERFMREQVRSALRYPSFVVLAMAVAIVIVNIFVIPAFAKVFAGFGTVGFLDDFKKLKSRKNKGLSARDKFLSQCAVSLAVMSSQ